jgi:predicted dehydrogenase
MSGDALPSLRVGLIGLGGICARVHYPGLARIPGVSVVGLCDADPALCAQRAAEWGVPAAFAQAEDLLARVALDAVVVATPNVHHRSLVLASLVAGCHVLCEKPIGMDAAEAALLWHAAEATGRRHMTAFTYRFIPAMRYLRHLVHTGALGQIRHARFQRLQDWGEAAIGWRQYHAQAGYGELGDMGIHRIDLAEDLLGPAQAVCGGARQVVERDRDRSGDPCPRQDVEDWVAWLAEYPAGVTAVFEMGKLTKGRGPDGGHDVAEINGSEASAVYELHHPHQVLFARRGEAYAPVPVPEAFLKMPGSPRDAGEGDPMWACRYDQAWEFVSAIAAGRDCVPSFQAGARAQQVADAVLASHHHRRWIDVPV